MLNLNELVLPANTLENSEDRDSIVAVVGSQSCSLYLEQPYTSPPVVDSELVGDLYVRLNTGANMNPAKRTYEQSFTDHPPPKRPRKDRDEPPKDWRTVHLGKGSSGGLKSNGGSNVERSTGSYGRKEDSERPSSAHRSHRRDDHASSSSKHYGRSDSSSGKPRAETKVKNSTFLPRAQVTSRGR